MSNGTYDYLYQLSRSGTTYSIASGTDVSGTGSVTLTETTDNNTYVAQEQVTPTYSSGATGPTTLFYRGTVANTNGTYPVFATSSTGGGGTFYVASDTPLTTTSISSGLTTGTTPACYMAGTMIATPEGERAVETLGLGDEILTQNGVQRVKFVARSTRGLNELRATGKMPVLIRAGAFGEAGPSRDLWISPAHALLLAGHLVEAGALINGSSVSQPEEVGGLTVTYYNIELEAHAIIQANGIETESYFANWRSNGFSRESWDNYSEYLALYGESAPMQELDLPRIPFARQLPAEIRLMLQVNDSAAALTV